MARPLAVPAIGSRHVPRPRAGRGEQPVTVRQVHRRDRAVTAERDDGTKASITIADLRRKWQPEASAGDGSASSAAAEAHRTAELEAELRRRNPSHPPELARAQAEAMADAVRTARRLTLAQRDALARIAAGHDAGYAARTLKPLVAWRLAFVRPGGELELTAAGSDVLRAIEHGA